jgi:hypothetical protein
MSKNAVLAAALAGVFCLAAAPLVPAQLVTLSKMDADVYVQVRAEADGEVSMSAWSSNGARDLLPVLSDALHCSGRAKRDPDEPIKIRCAQALRRDGFALEGIVDLAPIARKLAPSERIQFWINYPRMGIASLSTPMEERPSLKLALCPLPFTIDLATGPINLRAFICHWLPWRWHSPCCRPSCPA